MTRSTRSAQVVARLRPDLLAHLQRLAAARRWSVSAAVEAAVEEWCEREERAKEAKR